LPFSSLAALFPAPLQLFPNAQGFSFEYSGFSGIAKVDSHHMAAPFKSPAHYTGHLHDHIGILFA
jgi:hypothetical protein